MKKLSILLIMLLVIPICYATLEIERLKVYVNEFSELKLENIVSDTDGGLIEDINTEDKLEFNFRLKHDYNETLKVQIKGRIEEIDNNDDLTETISEFDLGKDEEVTKTLAFTIPTDVKKDNYESIFEVNAEYENDTEFEEIVINFEIEVVGIEVGEYDDLFKKLNETFAFAEKWANEKAAKERMITWRDEWRNKSENFEGELTEFKNKYENLKESFDEIESRYNIMRDNFSSLQTQITDLKKSRTTIGVVCLIIGGIVVGTIMYQKPPTPEEFQEMGMEP